MKSPDRKYSQKRRGDDSAAVIALPVASGLFPTNETEVLDKMLTSFFGGNVDDGHRCDWMNAEEPLKSVGRLSPEEQEHPKTYLAQYQH